MTISQLKIFFDEFHAILGFETPASRDEMFQKLEDAIVGRSTMILLSGLRSEEKARYDAFVKTSPTPAKLRAFLEKSIAPEVFQRHFAQETERVVYDYARAMLQLCNAEQKSKLFEIFGKLLQNADAEVLEQLYAKAELST